MSDHTDQPDLFRHADLRPGDRVLWHVMSTTPTTGRLLEPLEAGLACVTVGDGSTRIGWPTHVLRGSTWQETDALTIDPDLVQRVERAVDLLAQHPNLLADRIGKFAQAGQRSPLEMSARAHVGRLLWHGGAGAKREACAMIEGALAPDPVLPRGSDDGAMPPEEFRVHLKRLYGLGLGEAAVAMVLGVKNRRTVARMARGRFPLLSGKAERFRALLADLDGLTPEELAEGVEELNRAGRARLRKS